MGSLVNKFNRFMCNYYKFNLISFLLYTLLSLYTNLYILEEDCLADGYVGLKTQHSSLISWFQTNATGSWITGTYWTLETQYRTWSTWPVISGALIFRIHWMISSWNIMNLMWSLLLYKTGFPCQGCSTIKTFATRGFQRESLLAEFRGSHRRRTVQQREGGRQLF